MPRLVITLPNSSEQIYELEEAQITVGRSEDNMIQIDHQSVSGHHAQLTLEAGGYELRDLGSTNGTRVNGEAITNARLNGGERIRFGRIEAVFADGNKAGGLQPLPEQSGKGGEVTSRSVRPADFRSTSPFRRHAKKKDPLSTAAILAACLAFGSLAYAIFAVLSIQRPS